MASTRNKNTPGNYCLEQNEYTQSEKYTLYKNSSRGEAYVTKFAGNGLNPCQIPWNKMSTNAPDIESFLFGINSTNLVEKPKCLTPEINNLQFENLYNNQVVFIPEPLIIEKNQRPYYY
jgi:hypothetical protein